MGSRSQTAIMVRLSSLFLMAAQCCWGGRERREGSAFLLHGHQMPHQFTALKRFVNFGKPTLRPWQPVTPLPNLLAPTFQAAVSSQAVAQQQQQTVPSLRLLSDLSTSSRVKAEQQARLVQTPSKLKILDVSRLQDNRLELFTNAVELPVRLHPEEELA